MSRLDSPPETPSLAVADRAPPTALRRALKRAGRAAGRCWKAANALPGPLGAFVLLLLPFSVLIALAADLLAFLFGSLGRATVSWTAIFLVLGLVLGLIVGGEALVLAPVMFGVVGLLVGATLGFLCAPIFQGLPDRLDQAIG